jgi:hypothetical protein
MSKVTTDCPHCKQLNVVEKGSAGVTTHGYRIKCSHCSKSWDDSLGEDDSFFKSAPSGELTKLRESLAELGRVVDAYVARRAAQPVSFQPQGQETYAVLKFVAGLPGGCMLESDVAALAVASRQESEFATQATDEGAAHAALGKALANGRPVNSSNYTRVGDGLEKDARSTTIVERTAPAPAMRRSFQPLSE